MSYISPAGTRPVQLDVGGIMRVLMVNKYLYARAGAETQMLRLGAALERSGVEVAYFGTADPRNETPLDRSYTFPCPPNEAIRSWRDRLVALANLFTGKSAHNVLLRALREFQPDVVHTHNVYHQIGCAVLPMAREHGIPLVMTVHDYKIVCPTYNLHDGLQPCFACRHRRFWNAPLRGCHHFGRTASVLLAAESFWSELNRFYQRGVDRFIVPSRYMAQMLADSGIPRRRLEVLHNAVDVSGWQPLEGVGDYFLYAGRLAREKGVEVLLQAFEQLRGIPLKIAGAGQLEPLVRAAAAQCGWIEYLGPVPHDAVRGLLQRCRAVILPSVWAENCPMILLEAFACGRPAIATHVGGVPELFEYPRTMSPGLIVPPARPDLLADAIRTLWESPAAAEQMGQAARRAAEDRFSLDRYVQAIIRLYASLRARSRYERDPAEEPAYPSSALSDSSNCTAAAMSRF